MLVLVKLIALILSLLAGALTFLFAILDKHISFWTVLGRMSISIFLFGTIGLIFARYLEASAKREVKQSPNVAESLDMMMSKDMEEELFDEQMERVRQVTETENSDALNLIFDSEENSQDEEVKHIFQPFTPEQFPNVAVPEKG